MQKDLRGQEAWAIEGNEGGCCGVTRKLAVEVKQKAQNVIGNQARVARADPYSGLVLQSRSKFTTYISV